MQDELAVDMLAALAQGTRFKTFRILMRAGPDGMPAGEIADALAVPQNSLSSHLKIMTTAGLITCRRDGRSLLYAVSIDATNDLIGYLVNDCCNGHPEICQITTTGKGC